MNKDIGTLSGPLLVFGGPYSNLAALKAMRAVADQRGIKPDNIICTGDIVAYCAEPQETIDLIRDWGVHIVQGNCEESLANDRDDCGCGFGENSACDLASKEWFNFARNHVTAEAKQWMATLPTRIYFNHEDLRYCCIHGGFEEQNQFIFESTQEAEKLRQLEAADTDVMIAGHCGLPFGQKIDGHKYWLNGGVVGMPANDGQSSTWYMTLFEGVAHWEQLDYLYASTVSAMSQKRLCEGYAKGLETGIWPSNDILPMAERAAQGKHIDAFSLRITPKKNSRSA